MSLRSDDDGGGAGLFGLVGQDVVDEDRDSCVSLYRRRYPRLYAFGEHASDIQLITNFERDHYAFLPLGGGGMLGLAVQDRESQRSEIDDTGDGTSVAVIDGDVDISSFRENLGAGHVHVASGSGLLADGGLETAVGARHERGVSGTGARYLIVYGYGLSGLDQDEVVDLLAVHLQGDLDGQVAQQRQLGAVRGKGELHPVVKDLQAGEHLVGVVALGLPFGQVPGLAAVPGDAPVAFLDLQDRGLSVHSVHEVTASALVAQPVAFTFIGLGIEPVPAACLLVELHGKDERLCILAVLAVHAAEQLYLILAVFRDDIPVVVEIDGDEVQDITLTLLLIHKRSYLRDEALFGHRLHHAPQTEETVVQFFHLSVDLVDLILHMHELVPDELPATAREEGCRHYACYDISFHFHGLYLWLMLMCSAMGANTFPTLRLMSI